VATVTSQLTRIHDLEGSLASVAIGGGAGAAANTDIFLQGAQSLGRRQSNVTVGGFLLDDGAGNDLSAAGVHVGAWIWHTHYAVLTALRWRMGSVSGSGDYDEHDIPLTEYPNEGGWIRVWVHVARTPEFTGGTGLSANAAQYFGPTNSLPGVGGNAANLVLDAIDHTTTGLLLTGTAGVFGDFVTADADPNNKYGVMSSRSGVLFCRARLILGSASPLAFADSGFVLIFPNQPLVSTTFMGLTVDLQNASTTVSLSDGTIRSAGTTRQGDLVVSGTSGVLTATRLSLENLRTIDLTAAATLTNCKITACDKLNQNGGALSDCQISGSTTGDGEAFIISDDPAQIQDCAFTFSDGHALELTTPGTYPFVGNTFDGFGADDTNDAAIFNDSGGLVTLNVSGGGTTPTVRNGSGASTVINSNVSVTVTPLAAGSEVRAFRSSDGVELDGTETSSGSSHLLSLPAGVNVDLKINNAGPPTAYEPVAFYTISFAADQAFNPVQRVDRNFFNPP
jgi:hypothetical protein